MLLLGNNAANHTSKLGVEPGLDPPVTARDKVASVEGLDVVDQLVGSVADAFLIACEECVDACVGKQSDMVIANNFFSPYGLQIFRLLVLVVQTAVVQMSL